MTGQQIERASEADIDEMLNDFCQTSANSWNAPTASAARKPGAGHSSFPNSS